MQLQSLRALKKRKKTGHFIQERKSFKLFSQLHKSLTARFWHLKNSPRPDQFNQQLSLMHAQVAGKFCFLLYPCSASYSIVCADPSLLILTWRSNRTRIQQTQVLRQVLQESRAKGCNIFNIISEHNMDFKNKIKYQGQKYPTLASLCRLD